MELWQLVQMPFILDRPLLPLKMKRAVMQHADTGVNGPSNSGSATPSATILDDLVANEVLDEEEATSVSFSSQFHQIIHSIFK